MPLLRGFFSKTTYKNHADKFFVFNPSRCRIFVIGKIRKHWIKDGLNMYLKRLPGLTIVELRDSNPQKEAKEIFAQLKKTEALIALTEEGETFSSNSFAKHLQELGSQHLAFVIGGAEGLDPVVKESARWQISLSPLTFPHEIARLLLIEQIYRADTILKGSPYHR